MSYAASSSVPIQVIGPQGQVGVQIPAVTTTAQIPVTSTVPITTGPPVTFTTKQKAPSYWDTPSACHPGRELYRCPIIIFVILIIIGIIINIWALFRVPRTDSSGKEITSGQMWVAGIVGIGFYLIVAFAIGWWVYQKCRECDQSSWVSFIIVILIAIILAPIVGLIIGGILGIGFLWTANQEPNDSRLEPLQPTGSTVIISGTNI